MPVRVAIGGISHETNTFCHESTPIEQFQKRGWLQGSQIIEKHKGVRTYFGGMLDAAAELGWEVVPGFFASTEPSGTIQAGAYAEMKRRVLEGIRAAMPVDCVCLDLHGAGIAEGVDDLEGDLIAAVRQLVGPSVPISAPLDLHGNITDLMVRSADGLFGVHLYPHEDMYDRGKEAMHFLSRVLKKEIRPVQHLERLPMLLHTYSTNLEPMKTLNTYCYEWEKKPGILHVSIFHGFPYADAPPVGMTVHAVADSDPALAKAAAQDVARRIWAARDQLLPRTPGAEEAIRLALAEPEGPVVINDTSDNPGGGAPGNSTHLLRAMLAAKLANACYGHIYDPEVAEAAHKAGAGATIRVKLGGKTDKLHGEPVDIEAYVKCLSDGQFRRTSPMGRGMKIDLGKMARLQVGGLDIVVASIRTQTLDPEPFLLHGIDVTRYKIVAVKSSAHFRAAFEPLAKRIIAADTPGLVTTNVKVFRYERIQRPVWPLDENATYPA